MSTRETLNNQFQEWVDVQSWQGEDEFTKNIAVGNVFNWFYSKFQEVLRDRIELKKDKLPDSTHEIVFVEDLLDLIK